MEDNDEGLHSSFHGHRLSGSAGFNNFKGGVGKDNLKGGDGIEVARYVGAQTDYTPVFANGILTLTDTVSERDGVDTVSQVERFDFAGVFYGLNGAGQLVAELVVT